MSEGDNRGPAEPGVFQILVLIYLFFLFILFWGGAKKLRTQPLCCSTCHDNSGPRVNSPPLCLLRALSRSPTQSICSNATTLPFISQVTGVDLVGFQRVYWIEGLTSSLTQGAGGPVPSPASSHIIRLDVIHGRCGSPGTAAEASTSTSASGSISLCRFKTFKHHFT